MHQRGFIVIVSLGLINDNVIDRLDYELIWHMKESEEQKSSLVSTGSLNDPRFDVNELISHIRAESKRLLGSIADCFVIRHVAGVTDKFIIQTNFNYFKQIWMSITMITHFKEHPLYIRVLHIAGSIKSAQKASLRLLNEELRVAIERKADARQIKQKQEQYKQQDKDKKQQQKNNQQNSGIQVLGAKDIIINPDDNIVTIQEDFSDDQDDDDDEEEEEEDDDDEDIMNMG
ncbi:RNase P protein subunit [Cavenderia fasciculata]|uniref:RNase P protein subunit n=1 Tax=Cavenderia fasciculata TaxID=261658 RepID=F4PU64_CACFS|nr:RNase P protein subunit [Cavenderia fasciculata]EGG20990.1 RNase P protein subunit [Cavenderia fasciculata]|eukprot:XP_004358840.1 RNase P protein subunit [Cavenderia fasciculata]